MNDKPFELNYILASCMYGTTLLAEIVPEVKKSGNEHLDIGLGCTGTRGNRLNPWGMMLLPNCSQRTGGFRDIDPFRFGSLRASGRDGVCT